MLGYAFNVGDIVLTDLRRDRCVVKELLPPVPTCEHLSRVQLERLDDGITFWEFERHLTLER